MSMIENFHHIVFRTKGSRKTIPEDKKRILLAYIYKVSTDMQVTVFRLNSYLNHVHILINLPADISISAFVQKIKGTSSHAFQSHPDFPEFEGWAQKYGSFSKSKEDLDKIIKYIKNQEDHHRYKSFKEELEELFGKEYFNDEHNRQAWFDCP